MIVTCENCKVNKGEEDEEIFEDNFDEDTNTYTDYNDDVISVYKVQEMTQKELDVLVKMGVLYR